MRGEYLKKIAALLERVYPTSGKNELEFKNVFGAVGGYVNGHIFISCGKFGVALRLPPKTLDTLFQKKDVKHLKYFPNGHIKKEYAVLPNRILKDEDALRKLVHESVKYVGFVYRKKIDF